MKKALKTLIFSSLIIGSSISANSNQPKHLKRNTLIVNLDKESKKNRGDVEDIIYGMLTITGDNDEVSFTGKMLANTSNIVIIIKDSAGKIKKTVKNSLTIKTKWLNSMDSVIIKKNNKTIVEKEVEKTK